MNRTGTLHPVTNQVRDYAWGSTTAIPESLGLAPTGAPQAEVWLGGHSGAPSILVESGVPLDSFLEGHPEALGEAAGEARLPFLMKLLAAASPLSLQVHPTLAQAREGFARDEAAGLSAADPLRSYTDDQHKPEVIVAVTPFAALCGFRSPAEARAELSALLTDHASSGVGRQLLDALALDDDRTALREAFVTLMGGGDDVRVLVRHAIEEATTSNGPAAATIRFAGEHYPDDPGVLAAALLNRVDLEPGEALYLDAGHIHAYLSGYGIEAMAASDNVLRGGLTPKHIDLAELLRVVKFEPSAPHRVIGEVSETDGVRVTSYRTPAREFSVHVIAADGGPRTVEELTGPSMLMVMQGTVEVAAGESRVELVRGESLFQAAGPALRIGSLDGPALAYLTTLGRGYGQRH